jgi:hypothetical protein
MQLGETNFAGEQLDVCRAFHLAPTAPTVTPPQSSKLFYATRDGHVFNDRYRRNDSSKLNHGTATKTTALRCSRFLNHRPAESLGSANTMIVAEPGGTAQNPLAAPDATATYCLPLIAYVITPPFIRPPVLNR